MSPSNHAHRRAARFEFSAARNTAALICTKVRDGAPVLHVSHDADGDWQFLCGGDHGDGEADPGLLVCLECVVADDLTLNDLADLRASWTADRDRAGGAWRRHDGGEDFIVEAVGRVGWAIELIEAGDDGSEPAFAYTVGLHKSFSAPELIVFGLPHEVMGQILNALGELIKEGDTLLIGQPIAGILEGCPVRLRPVRSAQSYRAHVGYALWFNGGYDFPLLQVLWPDKNGRFPGDPEVAAAIAALQPLLP